MKPFSLIFTVLIILWQNPAMALGLGTPHSQMVLGERLYIEIPIIGIGDLNDADLKIGIAGKETYAKMDIEMLAIHQSFEFSIKRDAEEATLVITSPKGINEPYLHFLIEMMSPAGSVLKDISLLLDAPK